jgi:predicted MFS family arabinose efflux permease
VLPTDGTRRGDGRSGETGVDVTATGSRETFVSGYPARQLQVLALGTITYSVGRFVLSPLLPTIIDSLGISAAMAGLSLTVMFGLGSLVRYPAGRLSDTLSRKTVLVVSLATLVAGFGLLSTATSYPTFLLALVALGLGTGMYQPPVIATLSDLFETRQGQALGINNSSIYVAGTVAAVLAVFAVGLDAWRVLFLPLAGLLLLVLLTTHLRNREAYALFRPTLELRRTGARLVANRSIRRQLLLASLFAFAWQGTVGFLPTFLQVEKGFDPAAASSAFAALFFIGIFANLLGGRFADSFGASPVIVSITAIATVGLGVVVVARTPVTTVLGIGVLSVGLAGFWPVMQTYIMELVPDDTKAGDYGAFSMVYIGVGSLGPTYVGVVADAANYRVAFTGLVLCLFLGSLSAVVFLRNGPNDGN